MIDTTIRGELVATQEEYPYIVYVFKDLDNFEYLTCVRFPNWDCPKVSMGQCGYINYRTVLAGVDTWYDKIKGMQVKYLNNYNHFINFIPEKIKIENFKID